MSREFALVDALAGAVFDLLDVVVGDLFLEFTGLERRGQIAVADAVDFDCDGFGVDCGQRNALLAGAGEHVGAAGSTNGRCAVADVNVEVD